MPILTTQPSWTSLIKDNYDDEVFAVTIGSNLYHWRKYRGLSQQKLSTLTGLTQTSISEIENGDANPTIETLSKLAKSLGIAVDLLTKNGIVWKMVEAVDYMSKYIKDIDVLKAMKLLYFADLESVNNNGQKITGLDYVRRTRGPFNQAIYQLNDIFPHKGKSYDAGHFSSYIALSPYEQKFLDHIITNYGHLTATKLMDLSYETAPMKVYSKGDSRGMGKMIL